MNNFYPKFIAAIEKQIERRVIRDVVIVFFRRCVYLLLVFKMLFVWSVLPVFYRHVIHESKGSLVPYNLMFLPQFQNYYTIYWVILIVILGVAIVRKGSYLLSAIVLIISLTYLKLTIDAVNFGDKLLNFLIFMLVFVREGAPRHSLRQFINNASVLIIQVHFCLIYFLNAYGKIMRPFWRDGSVFDHVWHLSYYAHTGIIPYMLVNSTTNFLTAWAVMLFEFIFPFLIWFKPFKKPLLIAGLFLHLGIATLLSLPDFGVTMIIVYILFWDLKSTISKVTSTKNSIHSKRECSQK